MTAQNFKDNFHPFFDHINTINGLSGNNVNCMYLDHRGFLWIGTHNGLNQYDGRNITVFKHNRFDNSSIVNNDVLSIAEDDSGFLWLGTVNGISKFNPYNHKSVNFRHDPANPFSLNENFKCHVYFDKNKTCWIGNEGGLSYYDRKTNHFIHLQILPGALNKGPFSSVGSFLEDQQGRFWLGTFSGLILFDRKKHTARRFIFDRADTTPGANSVTSLFCDHAGRIWLGTWGDGLNEFDPGSETFTTYKWNKKNRFAGTANIVTAISETKNEEGNYVLWFGSTEGLFRTNDFPVSDKTTDHILPDPSDPHGLSEKHISGLLSDGSKFLWIGTSDGVNQFTSRNQLFSNTFHIKGSPTKIIVDTTKNNIRFFVGTWYGDGLSLLDSNLKISRSWKRIPPGAANPDSRQISDIIKSNDGTYWIATFHGVYHFDMSSNKITSWLHQPGNSNSLSADQTTSLAEDKNGNIWIGTYGRGVDKFDPRTKTFTHFTHKKSDSTSLVDPLVWSIFIDKQKQIWIVTDKGIALYHEAAQNFSNFFDDDKKGNSLKGNGVNGIVEDKNGIYWIITDEGLNRFDFQKKQFTLYGTEEGLSDDNIYSIAADSKGLLWMCTPGGISCFNPDTKTFINYDEQNGLARKISGPMLALSDGNILVGGDELLLKFNPSRFKISSDPPPVYIMQMSVAGSAVSFQKPLKQSGPVILHYPQNSFSCSFSAPEFFNGDAVKYAYYMEGADVKWTQVGDRNFVSYSELAPGSYTLNIRAANSDGVWNEKGTQLKIKVLPPFWKTWWFRIAVLVLFAFLIYTLFAFRVRRIRREEALKTSINKQMADMRLKVLHTRINPHFMFNALNSIQECIYTQKTDAATKYLSKFSKLLRMILEQSENTFITIGEEIEILKLYLELESLRFDEEFSYDIQEENIESDLLEIPPMLIQPFVENALWHGLRHKAGDKKLSIHFCGGDDFITVTIEDNGIGGEASKAFTHNRDIKKQSLGIKISKEQLQMVGALSKQKTGFETEDIFSETGTAAGTRVTLTIPVLRKQ